MTRAFSKTIRRGRGGGRFNRSTGRQPLTGRAVAGLAAAGLAAAGLAAAGLAAAGLVAAGCGGGFGGDDSPFQNNNGHGYPDAGTTYECYSANDCQPGQYCNEFHRCVWPPQDSDGGVEDDGGEPYVPPETEHEYSPPASGLRYVYVALTDQDTVARIDSETLDIDTIGVGDRPDVLATAPGQDVAVVLNTGSSSVTLMRTENDVDTVVTLPTPPHFNRLAVSPGGQYAVAWFELTDPNATGIGSFQDVSIIRLSPGAEEVINVSVGFKPREVQFAPDDSQAWVITEDGVSILDLAQATAGYLALTVPLTADPFGEGDPDEVVVTPDGEHAFARWPGLAAVRAVDLSTGALVDTPLAGPPTDLDLTPAGDRLVAVVRSQSQVGLLDVPADIGDASAIQTVDCTQIVVGSAQITDDGGQALLYTNALNEKAVALLDLQTADLRFAPLRKGIRWVALAPDGRSALVLHNKVPGDPLPTDDFQTVLDKSYGFSLVDLDSLFVKLQITEADPGAFAFTPDGAMGYLLVADPALNLRDVTILDLTNFIVSAMPVGSHPEEVGAVAGTGRVYISQDHHLGRVSFIDVDTGQLRTVTGFQLNSQVIE